MSQSVPRSYLNSVSIDYLNEIKQEKSNFGNQFPLTASLIDLAIDKVYTTGRVPGKENHCDVVKPLPMKLTQRVYVPVKQFPNFNFAGKILGPGGNSLRRLEQKTKCKISLKGRNSMRDPQKEEELRNSGDVKYAHLHKNFFLEISTVGSPVDCYSRLAFALADIREYLVPDKNDKISKEQKEEMRHVLEIPKGGKVIEEVAVVETVPVNSPVKVLKGILKKPSGTPVVEEQMEVERGCKVIEEKSSEETDDSKVPKQRSKLLRGPKSKRLAAQSKIDPSLKSPKRVRDSS